MVCIKTMRNINKLTRFYIGIFAYLTKFIVEERVYSKLQFSENFDFLI